MNPILLDVPEQFETERLILRAPAHGDGIMVNEAIRESYESLNQWMNWANHIPEMKETEENVRKNLAKFLLRESFTFYMLDKSTGTFVGTCSLVRINWEVRQFEIGYWIRKSASGYGYMTEAVNGLTNFASEQLNANRIEIRCDTRNTSSRKVAERCGYHLEAILLKNFIDPSGQLGDDCIYTKVRLVDGTLAYPAL
jgi:ribosomal-protein-serine acetyltransferase